MALVQDDLWGHVLRRPAERPRLLTEADLLSETEVHLEAEREGVGEGEGEGESESEREREREDGFVKLFCS